MGDKITGMEESLSEQQSLIETDSRTEVSRGWGENLVFNGDRVSIWEYEKALEVDRGDGCTIS